VGKTTLLNMIAAVETPDDGEIVFTASGEALSLSGLSARQRSRYRREHIGYVFQFFNLVPTLTVAENVRMPLELVGRRDRLEEALARVAQMGLGDRLHAFPHQLSGGEQQRVALARALAHQPQLVLADEPTGNLDAATGARVKDLLWREVRTSGAALVVATHSETVAATADRQIVLSV
jgi:putative ABC transport system ATP-binding protein